MWQHANLNENKLATTRLSTDVSQNNLVVALPHKVYVDVNKAQYAFDARAQDPFKNIVSNARIMYENPDIPNDVVDFMLVEVMITYKKIMENNIF